VYARHKATNPPCPCHYPLTTSVSLNSPTHMRPSAFILPYSPSHLVSPQCVKNEERGKAFTSCTCNQPKGDTCPADPGVTNQQAGQDCTGSLNHGNTCILKCLPGYTKSGDLTCTAGEWDSPTCEGMAALAASLAHWAASLAHWAANLFIHPVMPFSHLSNPCTTCLSCHYPAMTCVQ